MWVLGMLAAASLPFWLPGEWVLTRAWISVPAVVWVLKLLELGRERINDPAMRASRGLLCFWFLVPPDTRPPRSAADAAQTRRAGWRRVARACLKAPALVGLVAAVTVQPAIHQTPVLGTLVGLLAIYLLVSGTADVVSGLAMQSGIWVAESFDAPLLARSPRDFWGNRWNLFVHRIALRHVFLPLRGLRQPVLAATLIFAASGALHEYLLVAAVGLQATHLGWMTAYFMLHGLAVAVELSFLRRGVPRLPRPVAVGAHLAWMIATGPLFLTPVDEAFSYTAWRLW